MKHTYTLDQRMGFTLNQQLTNKPNVGHQKVKEILTQNKVDYSRLTTYFLTNPTEDILVKHYILYSPLSDVLGLKHDADTAGILVQCRFI